MTSWFKRWVLWHMPCPVHGVEFTSKVDDPDCSWDAGLLTVCSACGGRWTGEIA